MNISTLVTISMGLVMGAAIGVAGYSGIFDELMPADWKSETVAEGTSKTALSESGGSSSGGGTLSDKNLALIAKAEAYVRTHPEDRQRALVLGGVLVETGDWKRAIKYYKERLEVSPEDPEFLFGLGWTYEQARQLGHAVAAYEEAYKADANNIGAVNNLAWVLATAPDDSVRDGQRAVTLAKQAMQSAGKKAQFLNDTLAAAYAETGDFESAVDIQRKVVKVAPSSQRYELHCRLKLYEEGQPYRSN